MVAKMAQTLDRLSGGRLILGLGAGASDEEFRAFGLGSAPRGTRSTGSRRPSASSAASGPSQAFSFAGRHYRTEGAELAPRPDHPIPLWLGTFGRRGLDITGRLADGWIPSLALALPDQAAVMRDRIVSAARRRPRSPAHHLRLQSGGRVENAPSRNPAVVAGSPDVVAERLLGFVRLGLPR
jgi:alkanesulfonate monooxygenase SsuD/methylene tetrahydromethanopterin reductase-like flavin-dependent oxidoreductase (luciferase family)